MINFSVLFFGKGSIIADTKLKDDKIIADFEKKGNNSILLKMKKNEAEVFNDIVNIDGSLVFDLLQADFSVNKGTTITTNSGLVIKNSILTVSPSFSGINIDLANYEKTATKVDVSRGSKTIVIFGNDSNNSIKGGKATDYIDGGNGNDTLTGGNGDDLIVGGEGNDILKSDAGDDILSGGEGEDTLTGGKGNDVFVYDGGNDIITDYKVGEDSIVFYFDEMTSSKVQGSNVILTTKDGSLTIKGTKDKAITFIDDEGNSTEKIFFADTYYAPLEDGLKYDAKRTVLTASSKFSGYTIDLNKCISTATKVNASAVNQEVVIYGNAENNSIRGGKNNDFLTGGAGNDTFFCDNGNDVITDYKAGEDTIVINDKVLKVDYRGQDVILANSEGTLNITVKNAKGKEISVIDSNGDPHVYSKTFDILCDNNFVTDEFNIDDVINVTENNYSVGEIEDSKDNDKICSVNIIAVADSFDN